MVLPNKRKLCENRFFGVGGHPPHPPFLFLFYFYFNHTRVKTTYRLSFADTWIAATAIFYDAILVHKDPEFEQLKGKLEMLKLPYKKSGKG
jgi:hypothetical protein